MQCIASEKINIKTNEHFNQSIKSRIAKGHVRVLDWMVHNARCTHTTLIFFVLEYSSKIIIYLFTHTIFLSVSSLIIILLFLYIVHLHCLNVHGICERKWSIGATTTYEYGIFNFKVENIFFLNHETLPWLLMELELFFLFFILFFFFFLLCYHFLKSQLLFILFHFIMFRSQFQYLFFMKTYVGGALLHLFDTTATPIFLPKLVTRYCFD